jgi:hypothetical protein
MPLASASLADLFTVPASDWAAIQRRVSVVLLATTVVADIQQALPHFPDLLVACQAWQATTLPAIREQSQQLHAYAADAQRQFGPLADAIDALDPNAPLPPAVRAQAETALAALQQATTRISASFNALREPISNFHLVNGQVDTELLRYQDLVAFFGDAITQATRTLDNATGRVQGDWNAISDDLRPLTSDQVDLTLAILASLGLRQDLAIWASIEQQTSEFERTIVPLSQ